VRYLKKSYSALNGNWYKSTKMNNYEKLVDVLREIFLLDQPDLDFGIFRIMNQKRDEIEYFLTRELIPQAKEVLQKSGTVSNAETRTELDKLVANLKTAGINPDDAPKVKELKAKLKEGADIDVLENEVFSHLAAFFKRYYDKGDFISMRRYKKDVYAIPYEGEEVKLHWANHDQYYIKSSEYLKNYAFVLPSGQKVNFVLVEATTEQNNNKAQGNLERRFSINEEKALEVVGSGLNIYFTYDLREKSIKQKALLEEAHEIIVKELPEEFNTLLTPSPTEKDRERTLLGKHLNDYTARNTFDYFIHKDLGAFLQRELDFYIKNEVLFIDDLNIQDKNDFLKNISIIQAIKQIGEKVITFLAQLENFQKKLWLKKKFVFGTNYCITLDKIPEEYYGEIASNQQQMEEWKQLFAVDEIKADAVTLGYEEPVSVEFLKQNPFLVLDTKFYSEDFKERLLAEFDNLDKELNGVLINSDNFQAIKILQRKYQNKIRTIYIDPPYNTPHSEILYKNQFKHSTWLSLIDNTVPLVNSLQTKTHSFGLAIDDYEFPNILAYLKGIYVNEDLSVVVVNHHPQGSGGKLSRTHEYLIICSSPDSPDLLGKPRVDYDEDRSFMRSGTADNNYRTGRWKSFYALLLDPKTNKIVGAEDPIPLDQPYPTNDTADKLKRIYPINSRNEERVWRASYLTGRERAENDELYITDRGAVKQKINHESKREVLFSNWIGTKYNAGSNGSDVLKNRGLGQEFDYPKSIFTVETALWAQTFDDKNAIILDYFAGSGTTGHAVINMNRYDKEKGNRVYILVEMGSYFETATKPRIQKVIYSEEWDDGKPTNRKGSSHMFKYFALESYEDVLNNLELKRDVTQERFFGKGGAFKEDYILSYMLDVEAEGSLLSVETFTNPFDYKLNITRNNQTSYTRVDLVETFNYLIGLNVETTLRIRGFKVVTGKNRDDEKVLVIWRNLEEKSNKDLNDFFLKQQYNTRDSEFDRIFVNGDNNLENLKVGDEKWKVALIEEEFKKRMFDIKDI
jgi:adenine-specific DNA-methyltransferase